MKGGGGGHHVKGRARERVRERIEDRDSVCHLHNNLPAVSLKAEMLNSMVSMHDEIIILSDSFITFLS